MNILLESGDVLLTELGDNLILEDAVVDEEADQGGGGGGGSPRYDSQPGIPRKRRLIQVVNRSDPAEPIQFEVSDEDNIDPQLLLDRYRDGLTLFPITSVGALLQQEDLVLSEIEEALGITEEELFMIFMIASEN
jgi:hypothetical protein